MSKVILTTTTTIIKIFWEDVDRAYEDMADRIAIRRLLPAKIDKFVDIAGGYGRLAKEYLPRAKHVTIFDYSKTELKQAKDKFGDRIITKAETSTISL